jgi:hypothetical protein
MTILRRRLSGGAHGKTIIPAKTILQQLLDTLSTPAVQAGVISQASAAQKTDVNKSTAGHKEEEEEESNAQAVPPKATTQTRNARASTSGDQGTGRRDGGGGDNRSPGQRSERKGTNAGNAGAKADETRGATRVRRRKGSAGSYS